MLAAVCCMKGHTELLLSPGSTSTTPRLGIALPCVHVSRAVPPSERRTICTRRPKRFKIGGTRIATVPVLSQPSSSNGCG